MPSFSDWLKGSWDDFRRRWAVLLGVAGVTGAAAMAGTFVAFVPAALLTAFGVGPAWAVWGAAAAVSIAALLWLSTWAQAAVTRAAMTEDPAGDCLSRGWRDTAAFGWVLTLTLLAVVGGYFLLVIPGLILSVVLFFGAFYQIAGEGDGMRALELSWGRALPRFGTVSLRLFAAGLIAAAPGWIPYIGWLISMFWTPFGIVAIARLARDLRDAEPEPRAPSWLGGAVAGLSGVFVVGTAVFMFAAVKTVQAAAKSLSDPAGLASRIKPETTQALIDAYTGQVGEDQKRKALADLLAELKTPADAPVVSSGTAR
jgi:hypothetical protein